jgi:chromosome segregation ATPase
MERELERDEFHRTKEDLEAKIEEINKDKERLEDVISNLKMEQDDCEMRLKDAAEFEQELIGKAEKAEDELKSAIDKV